MDIFFWKNSGAEVIPTGSLLKQDLSNGVIKVVYRADSSKSLICQNPVLASSFVKTVAPVSWANTWSTDGSMCLSLLKFSLSLVRSRHIHSLLFGLGTITIPAHQSVGCSTLAMTPIFFILFSSCFTLGIRGNAILLGVESVKDLASSHKLTWYSLVIVPRPLKRSGYKTTNLSSCTTLILALLLLCSKSDLWSFFTTKIFSFTSLVSYFIDPYFTRWI